MDPAPPLHYGLVIEPDLDRMTFDGRAHLLLNADSHTAELRLNALELDIRDVRLSLDGSPVACSFAIDPSKEELRVTPAEAVQGDMELDIVYGGKINDGMAGFYRSHYRQNGEMEAIAVTQFQESDARRAFPCFDHPARKATFELELRIPAGTTALSNMSVREEKPGDDGKIHVRFERTPIMSTYLLFFGVGQFRIIQDSIDPRVRAVTVPGKESFAEFGLEFARKALAYCERYYGIPYPLSKMDVIAVPDFAFGAMENWGAITFRENLLLHYPGITSQAGINRICEVISHEIAHQWFGNLVTPSDWKYLWLNESFATYFGFGVVDHYYPEWEIWDQFISTESTAALERDALLETFSIEIPGGEHVVINTGTAPIIYSKGGSLLRQVEGFIGPQDYRKGIQEYLNRHAYGNASSRDLWKSFEAASDKPIVRMVEPWIEQEGYPLVTATREGERLMLAQERFSFLPAADNRTWPIPLNIRLFDRMGKPQDLQVIMEDATHSIDLEPGIEAYKINFGQTGFFRVRYDTKSDFIALGRKAQEMLLPAVDRWGVENDLFALLKSGMRPLEDYLDYIAGCSAESSFLPVTSIAANLMEIHRLASEPKKETIRKTALLFCEELLGRIGMDPRAQEPHTTSIMREPLLWHASLYGGDRAVSFCREKFDSLQQGYTVAPDLMKSSMQAGARFGDETVIDWFERRITDTDSEHERMNIAIALGCVDSTNAMEKVLAFVMAHVPERNRFIPIVTMANNPEAAGVLWSWYTSCLAEIEGMHPLLYERIVAAVIPSCGLVEDAAVRKFFGEYERAGHVAPDVIRLSLERLEIRQRLRGRLSRTDG